MTQNLVNYHHVAVLLYPSKMLYPGILPLVSMLETLFKDAAAAQRKLKLFWFAFFWLVTPAERNLLIFELMTASFSGRFSQSGCSLFLQDFQYFALRIRGRRTSREYLEVRMEMKDLVYCRSA
jgi:hypothetical protein